MIIAECFQGGPTSVVLLLVLTECCRAALRVIFTCIVQLNGVAVMCCRRGDILLRA
jgi:hypothetical protein